jgi:FtsP/CotA-like multicopper oxidase with cupredoxin domain
MNHMTGTIDGRTFDMNGTVPKERVRFGDCEVWEFVNRGGHMGSAIPHSMHMHGVQFQVINRHNDPFPGEHPEKGWKDSILVMPGERVRFLMCFDHFKGLYLYHCHNLEHEDMGMMRNFLIQA